MEQIALVQIRARNEQRLRAFTGSGAAYVSCAAGRDTFQHLLLHPGIVLQAHSRQGKRNPLRIPTRNL